MAASKEKHVKEGNVLYDNEDYPAALEKYKAALKKDPESDIINYGLGTIYYQEKDYPNAITHLQKSLLSENEILQAKAHHNLGNSYYKFGIQYSDEDVDLAIASLEQSLSHYQRSQNLRTGEQKDPDTEYNYSFVLEELNKLRKVQQQKQKSQNNKKSNSENQEQKENKESQPKNENEENDSSSEDQQSNQENPPQDQKNENSQQQEEDQDHSEDSSSMPDDDENNSESDAPLDSDENEQKSPPPSWNQPALRGLSEEEANMLLEDYKQTEEPQGLLNFMKRKGKESNVLKDW